MKNKRDIPFITYFPTSAFPIYFGVTTDEVAFNKELKRLGVEEEVKFAKFAHGGCTHFISKVGESLTIIVTISVDDNASTPRLVGLAAHEASHVWDRINEEMGCAAPGGEHSAYGLQWITQCISREIWEG